MGPAHALTIFGRATEPLHTHECARSLASTASHIRITGLLRILDVPVYFLVRRLSLRFVDDADLKVDSPLRVASFSRPEGRRFLLPLRRATFR